MTDDLDEDWGSLDEVPADAFAFDTTPFDFIVVGSGAGGGPLAGRLALGGMRVLVLEAGGDLGSPRAGKEDENQHPIYHCPGLHTASTEPEVHTPTPASGDRFDCYVRHYTDNERQNSDSKAQPFPDLASDEHRQLYPRAAAIGGCTAHYAMIAVAPPDDDWQYIADLTGDVSWRPELMRLLFRRLERFTRGKHFTRLGELWDRFLDKWNPDRHLAGQRGNQGWLDVSFTDPQLALGDSRLINIIKRAALSGQPRNLTTLWRWIKRFVAGRFYQDLDLNDPRTMNTAAGGVALLPLAVSSGVGTPWSPRPGMRRGPREFLFETRDKLRHNSQPRDPSDKKGSLSGYLCIVPKSPASRIVFRAGPNANDAPRAVGVELQNISSAAGKGSRCCFARREVIVCAGRV